MLQAAFGLLVGREPWASEYEDFYAKLGRYERKHPERVTETTYPDGSRDVTRTGGANAATFAYDYADAKPVWRTRTTTPGDPCFQRGWESPKVPGINC